MYLSAWPRPRRQLAMAPPIKYQQSERLGGFEAGPMTLVERSKPGRRDSHLRRDRIVRAAVELYASDGMDVALEKIADRALVGRATLYRNFPDRDALTAAVMQHYFDDLTEQIERWADRDDAFFLGLSAIANLNVASRGFEKMVSLRRQTPSMSMHAHQGLENVLKAPLARAKKAGLVRDDFDLGDTLLIGNMLAAGGLAEPSGDTAAGIERAMRLLMPVLAPPTVAKK
jgi:AcrR family transcriptional regulator